MPVKSKISPNAFWLPRGVEVMPATNNGATIY